MKYTNHDPVFKYMSADVAQIVLVNQKIRWSSPTLFDDPLDVARVWDLGFSNEELQVALLNELDLIYQNEYTNNIRVLAVINSLRQKIPKLFSERESRVYSHVEELNQMWKRMIPEMRILCLSRKCDIIPLWATYADNHKGAVMEFHPQKHNDSGWLLAEPVTYTDKRMSLASPKEWARSILGIEQIDYKKIFIRYGCIKKKNWSFQEELRVFSFKRSQEIGEYSDYKFAPNDLKAIYFGYKASEETVQLITSLLKYDFSHVQAFKMFARNNYDGLSYEKIETKG
jgi:hypothetical protein